MILGIDYASVDSNARPNLAAAKSVGLRFAFVRASYDAWSDPTAARDRDAIRAAGLVFGAYLFPIVGHDPERQVHAFYVGAGLVKGRDFPPVLDIEFPGGIEKTGKTRAEIADWLARARRALENAFGCTPIIYSSARVLDGEDEDCLHGAANDALRGCPLWLSRYPFKAHLAPQFGATLAPPPVPAIGGDADAWWMHQFQGDAVQFPGFTSTVDVNRFNLLAADAKGSRVRWLQERLAMPELLHNGAFDVETQTWLQAFQQRLGLDADGVVGPATFAALAWEP